MLSDYFEGSPGGYAPMKQWKRGDNYDYRYTDEDIRARVYYTTKQDRTRREVVAAYVQLSDDATLRIEQEGFGSFKDARAWADVWIAYATQYRAMRHDLELACDRQKRDWQEIVTLRGELHDYRYPHTQPMLAGESEAGQ